jgi:hypothetical protein
MKTRFIPLLLVTCFVAFQPALFAGNGKTKKPKAPKEIRFSLNPNILDMLAAAQPEPTWAILAKTSAYSVGPAIGLFAGGFVQNLIDGQPLAQAAIDIDSDSSFYARFGGAVVGYVAGNCFVRYTDEEKKRIKVASLFEQTITAQTNCRISCTHSQNIVTYRLLQNANRNAITALNLGKQFITKKQKGKAVKALYVENTKLTAAIGVLIKGK